MQVVYPYTRRYKEATDALDAFAPGYEAVYVGWSDTAYWQLLRDLWEHKEPFVIVEHDVVIHEQVIDGFARCGLPWCLHAYGRHRYPDRLLTNSLGCVRFNTSLMEDHPDLVIEAGRFVTGMPHRHYIHLDDCIFQVLKRLTYGEAHVHTPPVRHLCLDEASG
jgi:hypothetical protein